MKIVATALAIGFLAATAAPAQAVQVGGFSAAVERLLLGLNDGPVSRMDDARKAEMIACVTDALAGVPAPKKRFIAEAGGYEELKDRFGKVVMADNAAWKQKIARACARLV